MSVIICCYNSASRIEETLHFLRQQRISPGMFWEIVVVNNASSDATREVVARFVHDHSLDHLVKLVDEYEPGLASARKKGVETASYDILVFCDDDNHFDGGYVQKAFTLMKRLPEVGIAGGWAKPKLSFYPGKWIEGNYSALAIGKQAANEGFVDWVFGAGMVIRKKIYDDLQARGISLMLTGRLGTKQMWGDDAEMCHIARFLGYKIYYSPELILYHKISAHRLTRSAFIKANWGNVYPVIYFYILDCVIREKTMSVRGTYLRFLRSRLYNVFYFFPRMFLGRYNFYSFMMFFQNAQVIAWLVIRWKLFSNTFEKIKFNLLNRN